MRSLLLSLSCLVLCAAVNGFVGGEDVILGQIVHQGYIRHYDGSYVCGVWIHSRRWHIAPAYYMQGRNVMDTSIVYGTVSVDGTGDVYPVTEIFVHPNFNLNTLDNNIALLNIDDGVYWRPYVHPIPIGSGFTRGNVIATVAGWSRNEVNIWKFTNRS